MVGQPTDTSLAVERRLAAQRAHTATVNALEATARALRALQQDPSELPSDDARDLLVEARAYANRLEDTLHELATLTAREGYSA